MENKPKKLWVLLGIIVVIVIIIIVAASQGKKQGTAPTGENAPAGTEQTPGTTGQGTTTQDQVVDMRGAKAEIPGANPITKDNKVVTPEGKQTKTDVIPMSADAPKPVLISKDQLTNQVMSLEIGNGTITPKSFKVGVGDPVSLAVSSSDGKVHVFIFTKSEVGAIAMGVAAGETKAMTFNAPAAGTYDFRCDVPGHKELGEVGQMIVE